MVKVEQTTGTEAGQEKTAVPVAQIAHQFATPVRPAGSRAILVSSRSAVWDEPAAAVEAVGRDDDLSALSDPIWDHRRGTRWTPDLVHCRLLDMADTFKRLPRVLLRGFSDGLFGMIEQSVEEAPFGRPEPPTASAITLADWTFSQLIARPPTARAICVCHAFGWSVRKIAKKLSNGGASPVSKSAVHRDYLAERRHLAATWQKNNQQVDLLAFNRWRDLFEQRNKMSETAGTL
jgi:hypothetical protein